jgi:HlyD family secretion protein
MSIKVGGARKKRTILVIAGIVVLVAVVTGMALKGRGGKVPVVQTAKVSRAKIVQRVSATGKIQPKTKVEISADVSGKIEKLPVVEGQWVNKGTLLVSLARERYLAAVESAVAAVSAAEANASLVSENKTRTENEYKRSKQMVATGLESQSSFEAKQAEFQVEVARYKSAQDQVAQSRAALKQARDDLSKTTIYAPMSGTVSALNKEMGEIALGSQFQKDVILTVADLTAMEAEVNVDENDIMSIALGQEAEIEVDALPGQSLKGVVSEIGSSAVSQGQGTTEQKTEFEIKIAILNPPKTLRPGMTASANITTKVNDNALSVPLQAVAARSVDQLAMKGQKRKDAEGRYQADKDGFVEVVFCVENGKAVAKQVKTGIQGEDLIEGDQRAQGRRRDRHRKLPRDLEGSRQRGGRERGQHQEAGTGATPRVAGLEGQHEQSARAARVVPDRAPGTARQQGSRRSDHARNRDRDRGGGRDHDRREWSPEPVPRELRERRGGRPLRLAHAVGEHERLPLVPESPQPRPPRGGRARGQATRPRGRESHHERPAAGQIPERDDGRCLHHRDDREAVAHVERAATGRALPLALRRPVQEGRLRHRDRGREGTLWQRQSAQQDHQDRAR